MLVVPLNPTDWGNEIKVEFFRRELFEESGGARSDSFWSLTTFSCSGVVSVPGTRPKPRNAFIKSCVHQNLQIDHVVKNLIREQKS